MKKLILSSAFAALSMLAFAQKPTAGSSTLETQLSLNLGGDNGFSTPEIRYRYFLKDNMAARVRLNLGTSNFTENISDGAATDKKTGTIKTSSFDLNLAVGAEKHFAGTSKFSPYYGAELMLGFGTGSNKTADGSDDGIAWTGAGDKYETSGGGTIGFGLRGVFGADYYFTDAIYVGGEMGWGLSYTSTSEQKEKSTPSGVAAVEGTISEGSSSIDTGLMNFPTTSVRLGFRF